MKKNRKCIILCGNKEAGLLEETQGGFRFAYFQEYLNQNSPPISLTLPVRKQPYESDHLFSFFYGLLPEGQRKRNLCRDYKIDDNDYFGILLISARDDTIGNILIRDISDEKDEFPLEDDSL